MKTLKFLKIGGFVIMGLWLLFCIEVIIGGTLKPNSTSYQFLLSLGVYTLLFSICCTIFYAGAAVEYAKEEIKLNENK